MLDKSLHVLHAGVIEGRRGVAIVIKYILIVAAVYLLAVQRVKRHLSARTEKTPL